jgi:peptidyl-prolyl cis-trans isomerase SurA
MKRLQRAALHAALFACLVLTAPASSTLAQGEATDGTPKIAAVVNRDAISIYDLEQRIRLLGLANRLPPPGEARRRLSEEVLRAMIGERLQIQEARRLNLEINEAEIQEQWADIERRSRMGRGDLARTLRQRGIDPKTLEDQIRASVAWGKVIGRAIAPQIRVADSEVEEVVKRYKDNKDRWQYRVSEIFLPVDRPDQDGQAQRTAQHVLGLLRAGANFELVARQFSQTGTASAGGDMGWLFEGQLEPELERTVKQLKSGQIAGPIRSLGGYYIVRLADRRTFGGVSPDVKTVALAQAIFTTPRTRLPAEIKATQDKVAKVTANAKTCEDFVKQSRELGGEGRIVPDVVLERTPPQMRVMIGALKESQISRPVATGLEITIIMRCPDALKTTGAPREKEIREALQQQRLRAFADRYLKELRRSAFVDIRV